MVRFRNTKTKYLTKEVMLSTLVRFDLAGFDYRLCRTSLFMLRTQQQVSNTTCGVWNLHGRWKAAPNGNGKMQGEMQHEGTNP